jgi:2-methylcitrate dehydratase PrpD
VLADFTPHGLSQPEVAHVANHVEYRIQPDLGASAIVEVTLRGGEHIVQRVDRPLGHPDKPLSDDALRRKFFDCGQYAANGVSRDNLERVLEAIEHLEQVEDVRLLTDLVSPAARSVHA